MNYELLIMNYELLIMNQCRLIKVFENAFIMF